PPFSGCVEVLECKTERIHHRVTRRTSRTCAVLRNHFANRERLRCADVFLVQSRDIWWWCRRWNALNIFKDESTTQHGRSAIRVRGGHQNSAFAEQTPAGGILEFDSLETIPFDVRNSVVKRNALVEKCVVRF